MIGYISLLLFIGLAFWSCGEQEPEQSDINEGGYITIELPDCPPLEDINEETFAKNLYMEDEPELIIRTGGAQRTSNFLLWQSHYSEWIFLEKFWPEFEKEDFVECINEFSRRERRFGK